MHSLHTERLVIREFDPADWQALHHYASDFAVVEKSTFGPLSEAESQAFIATALEQSAVSPRATYELAVVCQHGLIGNFYLGVKNVATREAEIGYVFAREAWGKGYATEAARGMVRFGFATLGLHRIYATSALENFDSQRVLTKIGMQREGVLRQHVLQRGAWRDSLLFAILEDEWREQSSMT